MENKFYVKTGWYDKGRFWMPIYAKTEDAEKELKNAGYFLLATDGSNYGHTFQDMALQFASKHGISAASSYFNKILKTDKEYHEIVDK